LPGRLGSVAVDGSARLGNIGLHHCFTSLLFDM
jgi:hypothetical protein